MVAEWYSPLGPRAARPLAVSLKINSRTSRRSYNCTDSGRAARGPSRTAYSSRYGGWVLSSAPPSVISWRPWRGLRMHDLVVRNGTVVDGTGRERFVGDVAVDGGIITAVGSVDGRGRRELDARELLVTPGWVDVHTH